MPEPWFHVGTLDDVHVRTWMTRVESNRLGSWKYKMVHAGGPASPEVLGS